MVGSDCGFPDLDFLEMVLTTDYQPQVRSGESFDTEQFDDIGATALKLWQMRKIFVKGSPELHLSRFGRSWNTGPARRRQPLERSIPTLLMRHLRSNESLSEEPP